MYLIHSPIHRNHYKVSSLSSPFTTSAVFLHTSVDLIFFPMTPKSVLLGSRHSHAHYLHSDVTGSLSLSLVPSFIDPHSVVRGHSLRVNAPHNHKDDSFLQRVHVIYLHTSTFSPLWPLRRDITRRNYLGHSLETGRVKVVCPIRPVCVS